jgi:hypothetical protein
MNKHYIIFLFVSMCLISIVYAVPSASSTAFSDSYLLRAKGSEALYWNPASISADYHDIIVPGFNNTFYVANNSFNLDTYNYISGRYLTVKDKQMILDKVNGRMSLDAQTQILLFGTTFGNMAFASSTHGQGNVKISEKYLRLALFGNENEDYVMTKSNNQVSFLSYQDFTLGRGNINISQYFYNDAIPEIYMGVSGSLLAGIGTAKTEYYHGSLHSGLDGMTFNQDVRIKTGVGGYGGKALIGFKSMPVSNLELGLSFDNIFGNIHWFGNKQRLYYSMKADSSYISDLEDDFVVQEDSMVSAASFDTRLPLEMRLGSMYTYRNLSVSMDWVQGFANSQVTSSIGRICFGAEYQPIRQLPLQMGLRLGNKEYPWGVSYGIGFKAKYVDGGIGLISFESLFPGYKSKGISFASNLSIHY